MKVPESYYDEIFAFAGEWDVPSCCGLKIKQDGDRPVIVVTELYQENPGTSVTAAGRKLAEQICKCKGFELSQVRYIECNPDTHSKLSFYDESYFEVSFFDAEGRLRPAPVYTTLDARDIKDLAL